MQIIGQKNDVLRAKMQFFLRKLKKYTTFVA